MGSKVDGLRQFVKGAADSRRRREEAEKESTKARLTAVARSHLPRWMRIIEEEAKYSSSARVEVVIHSTWGSEDKPSVLKGIEVWRGYKKTRRRVPIDLMDCFP